MGICCVRFSLSQITALYVQSTVASRSNQKLSFRFYGPFKITQRVGQVAYKVDLPPDAKIHPVRGDTVVPQYLIQWGGLPAEMATWEDVVMMSDHLLLMKE